MQDGVHITRNAMNKMAVRSTNKNPKEGLCNSNQAKFLSPKKRVNGFARTYATALSNESSYCYNCGEEVLPVVYQDNLSSKKADNNPYRTCSNVEQSSPKGHVGLQDLSDVRLTQKKIVLDMEISMFTCGGPQIHLKPTTVASNVEVGHFRLKFMQICKITKLCSTYMNNIIDSSSQNS